MVNGRRRERWDHTASVMMLIANVNRGKGRRYYLSDFHPYHERRPHGIRITADTIGLLIEAFVPPERRVTREAA